ncbi:MAG: methyl-accepting chemotaxis protein [Desulfobulbaceae bacterium]|nr:methyl-accepting chemotaxis protein [Desulfobulbaceae bacterium]
MRSSAFTIGKKISLGFVVILTLLAIMVLTNTIGVNHIVEDANEVIDGNKLDGMLAQKEVDHLNWVAKVATLLNDKTATELQVETDHTKCGFGKWLYGNGRKEAERLVPTLIPLLKSIEEPHKALHDSAINIKEVFVQADSQLPAKLISLEAAHLGWANRVRDAIITKSTTLENVETDPAKCGLGKWLESDQAKTAYTNSSQKFKTLFDSIREGHSAMHTSAIHLKELLAAGKFDEATSAFSKETLPRLNATIGILKEMTAEAENQIAGKEKAQKIYTAETIVSVHAVQDLLGKIRKEARSKIMTDDVMIAAAVKTRLSAIIFGVVTILIGIGFALFLARTISRLLTKVADKMNIEASQVAAASGQILSSSQALADGASSQAAAVEQISATMEEVTAMTRQDADNAMQSEVLIKEANQVLQQTDNSMKKLTSSMEEISQASTETHKIVKTIDEIAFQTNLLALNAAVEAARAGEAGAGFAVVANEVRSLAMRATEAAKNTSDLIEGTVQKIKAGSVLVAETNASFHAVSQSIEKMNVTVGEIAGSTKEQAVAISQVNSAICQVDTITQQNAATAEETASASADLNAQVANIRLSVQELLVMVGSNSEDGKQPQKPAQHAEKQTKNIKSLPAAKSPASQPLPKPQASLPPKEKKVKAQDVIPFDEQEFEDF